MFDENFRPGSRTLAYLLRTQKCSMKIFDPAAGAMFSHFFANLIRTAFQIVVITSTKLVSEVFNHMRMQDTLAYLFRTQKCSMKIFDPAAGVSRTSSVHKNVR